MAEFYLLQSFQKILHALSLDERRCVLCHAPFSPSDESVASCSAAPFSVKFPLCKRCRSLLSPRKGGYCPSCGHPYALADTTPSTCGECLTTPPPWEHFRFYNIYADTLKTLILRGKFGSDNTILHLLGTLLAQVCLDLPRPDAIVPVPLHTSRLRERGFNQCQEMAYPLAELLHVPLRPDLLSRCLPTRHQVGLSREDRLKNLKNAFQASPGVRGLRILLVDDTCTTGTTLRRAAQALLDGACGAKAVDVAVVARASLVQNKM